MKVINKVPEGYALYECPNGRTYAAHQKSCIFCRHCDIIWDYTNGPYMFTCSAISADADAVEAHQQAAFELGGCCFYEEVSDDVG
jgi:hypothetical protein